MVILKEIVSLLRKHYRILFQRSFMEVRHKLDCEEVVGLNKQKEKRTWQAQRPLHSQRAPV